MFPVRACVNTDFSIIKDTRVPKISEAFNVQFRAEFFNIFNHANFSLADCDCLYADLKRRRYT